MIIIFLAILAYVIHEIGHMIFYYLFSFLSHVKIEYKFTVSKTGLLFTFKTDSKVHIFLTSIGGVICNCIGIMMSSLILDSINSILFSIFNLLIILNSFTNQSEDLRSILKLFNK